MKVLLPVLALAVAALAAMQYLGRKAEQPGLPPVADVDDSVEPISSDQLAQVLASAASPLAGAWVRDLNETVAAATKALAEVTDEASAEAALPKIERLSGRLEELKKIHPQVPETAMNAVAMFAGESIEALENLAKKVAATPEAGDRLRSAIDSFLTRLAALQE
ncbi:MAG: hypothetical protein ACT4QC_17550 [Planctomycetaceae bacterium]